ncbi:MAG: hypothetical protein Q9223_007198, partial [Gallowayella weberi]
MARKAERIDLNRALPKPPANEVSPMSSRPPSLRHHDAYPEERHYGSVRPLQTTSSKQQLQYVTRKLLNQGSPPNLRHYPGDFDTVDPVKFSPPEADRVFRPVTDRESSAESESGAHLEGRLTRFEDFLRGSTETAETQVSPNVPRYRPTKYQHRPKGMSHSASENNISFHRQPGYGQVSFDRGQQHSDYDDESIYSQDSTSFAQPRGRLDHRTPSPVKTLEDIKEDQTPEGKRDHSPQMVVPLGPPVTPVTPVKRSRSPVKQLFGENGFLGRSTSMKELPSEEHRKKGVKHFVEKLNQRVGGITEGVSKYIPASISQGELSKLIPASISNRESPSKGASPRPTSKFPVSLSPPEQAKFYSDAELMICATANKYLVTQHEEGRMSHESIKKITDLWAQKNRPQVIEFMFDQLTQRDLILYNLKSFRFYGPNAENLVSLHGMMQAWKTLAREMCIRTFCTGDSTMRKQMQDIYKILEMLGAPMVTFLAFQQIQLDVLRKMREQQRLRDEYEAIKFGVERKWEPPGGFPVVGTRGSAESEAYANPFVDPVTPSTATAKGTN